MSESLIRDGKVGQTKMTLKEKAQVPRVQEWVYIAKGSYCFRVMFVLLFLFCLSCFSSDQVIFTTT